MRQGASAEGESFLQNSGALHEALSLPACYSFIIAYVSSPIYSHSHTTPCKQVMISITLYAFHHQQFYLYQTQ